MIVVGILPKVAVFLLSVTIGASGTFVATSALTARPPASAATDAPDYLLESAPDTPGGPTVPVGFDLARSTVDGEEISGLPPAELAALATQLLDAEPVAPVNPSGFPRVPPVTQFDGGPLANANCTMASGAMLARLGFGIVTTGTILRSLQDDQDGGTGLDDLQVALWRGYGVTAQAGAVTPAQLKNLLAAGYGAVVQGVYGRIPAGLRLQASYTGGHAIYIDGYYPGDATTPEAYYVMDPLGRPSAGYEGDWWPASVVDDFGAAFGPPGRILAAWVFPPGGTPPDVVGPNVLQLPAPGGGGSSGGSPDPGESPDPDATPDVPSVEQAGDIPAPDPLPAPGLNVPIVVGGLDTIPALAICAIEPKPSGCPTGVPGVFRVPPIVGPFTGGNVTIRFVDSDQPNVALVGFTVAPSSPATVRFWRSGVSDGIVQQASSMWSLLLPSGPVVVAKLDVLAGTTYHFQVAAGNGVFAAVSPVGTFTTAGGVTSFDVALEVVTDPLIRLGQGLSPYRHLAPGGLAPPMDLCLAITPDGHCQVEEGPRLAPGITVQCLAVASFGGSSFCLERTSAPPSLDQAVCTRAAIDFELVGVGASAILIRAFPSTKGLLPDGSQTLRGVLELELEPGARSASIGCLAPGLTYTLVIDAVSDDRGPLRTVQVAIPAL